MSLQDSLDVFLHGLKKDQKTHFRIRPAQETMIREVIRTFESNLISLIEAPTGTGKSLAYLIPSLLYWQEELKKAEQENKTSDVPFFSQPVVISTATLALQNQLIEKDIPKALELVGNSSLSTFVLKGRSNYLCKTRLKEFCKRQIDLSELQSSQLDFIMQWAEKTQWGDKEELPFSPDTELWSYLCGEANLCISLRCALTDDCYFYRNKRQASQASLIIVNHALLAHDLAIKSKWGLEQELNAILPTYKHLIIDEAHKFCHSLESAYAFELSYPLLNRLLKRIDPQRKGNLLYAQLFWNSRIIKRISLILIEITQAWREADSYLAHSFENLPNEDPYLKRGNFRVLSPLIWESNTYLNYLNLSSNALNALKELLKRLKELREEIKNHKEREDNLAELNSLILDLGHFLQAWNKFLQKDLVEEVFFARWIKIHTVDEVPCVSFHLHPMELGSLLNKKIYPYLSSLLLTSATLSVNNSFHNFSQTLGLDQQTTRRVNCLTLPSNFCPSRVHFCGPNDFPTPENKSAYFDYALPAIQHLISLNRQGGTLILATSYDLVYKIEEYLKAIKVPVPVYSQGMGLSNKQLIRSFKDNKPSVLIGTDSFWEGIDLAGDFLTLLIIAKLPFNNPCDPLHYTKRQYLQEVKNKNAFSFYDLPQAVLKFKQGFGRLMRQKDDWGAIVCLDTRLQNRNYGKVFLQSLQPYQFHSEKGEKLMEKVEKHLGKQKPINTH